MSKKDVYRGFVYRESDSVMPFESAEEAWFWFIAAQQAKCDGARFMSGAGDVPRPCEPWGQVSFPNAGRSRPRGAFPEGSQVFLVRV